MRHLASRTGSIVLRSPIKRRPRKAFDWSIRYHRGRGRGLGGHRLWRDGQARFLEICVRDVNLFVDILPKVLAACLIAAFVAVLMPRETCCDGSAPSRDCWAS